MTLQAQRDQRRMPRPLSDVIDDAVDRLASSPICSRCKCHMPIGEADPCAWCVAAEARQERRRAEAELRQAALWAGSGISPRHSRFTTWQELRAPSAGAGLWHSAIEKIRTSITSTDGPIILLIGPRGNGKTQIGVVAVSETIAAGKPARIISAVELLAELKGKYEAGAGGDEDWLRRNAGLDLLVVDEIGELDAGEWSRRMLTTLIDTRYRSLRCSLLIGNIKRDQASVVPHN